MLGISFTLFFFGLLALLPLYTWSIDFGMRKLLAKDQIIERAEKHMLIKRQTGFESQSGHFCSPGSYLCPASLDGGCCASGRLCALTNCPAVSTTLGGSISTSSADNFLTTSSSTSTPIGASDGCSAGYATCDPSVGGGCCLSGYSCGTSQCFPSSTSTPGSSSSLGSSTLDAGMCGVESYSCAASFSGGCCPTTRSCGVTDCPTFTTISTGDAIGTGGTDGSIRYCSTGSALCPASVDYGCCRLGYSCGLTNCVPTGTLLSSSADQCNLGSFLCAATLGGGCCQSGLECGPTNCVVPAGATFIGTANTNRGSGTGLAATENKSSATATITVTASPKKSGLSGGAIGGIVGGVVGGLALIALGVLGFCVRKKKAEHASVPPQQPPMAQTGGMPVPPAAPAGGYYQPGTGAPGYGQAPGYGYNNQNRDSIGPSELGSDIGSGVAKPYGNQFGGMPEGQIYEAPAHGMSATHSFEPVHGQQVYEVDGTSTQH